jgi:cation:H+ antiporter
VLLACTVGLVLLALAGQLIVTGARTVASSLGVGDFVVGAALVAFGTSIPELATTVVAQLRGHVDIGLGTVLGSNIFNGLFIVGTAAAIHPIVVGWQAVAATLAFGVAALALLRPDRQHRIVRVRGALLLALYAGYLIVLALWLPTLPPR